MGSTAYGGAFEATRDSNTKATEDGKKARQEPGGQGSKGSKESKQSAGGAVPTQGQQQPRQRLVTAVTQLVQQVCMLWYTVLWYDGGDRLAAFLLRTYCGVLSLYCLCSRRRLES